MKNKHLVVFFFNLLLPLGQSSSSLRQDSANAKKCSVEQLESFWKRNVEDGYHLMIKETLISTTETLRLKNNLLAMEKEQSVQYQRES